MRSSRSAFTLVELLVVISVTMLLASVAVAGARRTLTVASAEPASARLLREAVVMNSVRTNRILTTRGAVVLTAFPDGTLLVDTLPSRAERNR